MNKQSGFTLIELLICIVIIGILAGIAYPSYQGFIIKTRRADAQSELMKAQIEQSSYRITHPTYISDVSVIGLPSDNPYYTFSITSASAHTYLMSAKANKENSQNNDELACKNLFIDQNSKKTKDGELDNGSCWSN